MLLTIKPREIKATKKTIIPPNNSEQEIFFIQKSPQGIEKIKNSFSEEKEKIKNKYHYQVGLLLGKLHAIKDNSITPNHVINFFQSLEFLHTLNSKKNIILNQKEEIEIFKKNFKQKTFSFD
jgi:hypothetical protein